MCAISAQQRFEPVARKLLVIIAFLFPLGMGSVQHWSSGLLIAAVVVSALILGRDWKCSEREIQGFLAVIVLFLVLSAVSLVNASDILSGLKRLEKLAFLLFFYPLYLAIQRLKINLLPPLYYGLLVAGPVLIIVAWYYVYQLNYTRVTGSYSSILFGNSAMLVAVLVLAGYLGGMCKNVSRFFIYFSFFCAIGAAIASGTRGAWMALPVLSFFWVIIFFRDLSVRKVISIVLLLLSILIVFYFNDNAKIRTKQVFSDFQSYSVGGGENTSVGARLYLWDQAISIWQENPMIGTGLGDFRHDIRHRIETKQTALLVSYKHAHNIFFDALATTGILGLLGLTVAVFVVPAWLFFRVRYSGGNKKITCQALCGFTLLISFATFGLTEGWMIRSSMVSVFSFFLTILLASRTLITPTFDK